ncbi:hypothetical protein OKW11_000310 [Pseudomonas baetica]|nr:hypothetical protein [Pseudomonas baetica]
MIAVAWFAQPRLRIHTNILATLGVGPPPSLDPNTEYTERQAVPPRTSVSNRHSRSWILDVRLGVQLGVSFHFFRP